MTAPLRQLLAAHVEPGDTRYRVFVTRRFMREGKLALVGDLLLLPRLSEAAAIVRAGNGRPADRRTEVDVELALILQRVLPK